MSAPRPVTLITGATEGIGRAIAFEYAKAGHDLLLIARNPNALADLAKNLTDTQSISAYTLPLDLTIAANRNTIGLFLEQQRLYVDILVNNAGIGLCDAFIHHNQDELIGLIDLNVTALTDLCHKFLPAMIERQQRRHIKHRLPRRHDTRPLPGNLLRLQSLCHLPHQSTRPGSCSEPRPHISSGARTSRHKVSRKNGRQSRLLPQGIWMHVRRKSSARSHSGLQLEPDIYCTRFIQ